jgi:hypothetical protein
MMVHGLRGITKIFVASLAAAALCGSASSARSAAPGMCPDLAKAVAQGGCLIDPWPSGPSKGSQAVAKAIFGHKYTTAWGYIHPKLQKAIPESAWLSCQKKNPVASPGVKIGQVRIADSRGVPIALPLLGKQRVRTVLLQVLFTTPGSGQQVAVQYAYWVQDKGNWKAVWLPEQYQAYKSGRCDSGPQRGLY